MDSRVHISLNAEDRSYFSILKKKVHSIVLEAGFSERKIGEIDIIVAEITSNLIKHAGGGELLVRITAEDGNPVVEIISIDNGPGMAEPKRMVEDGISTSNTLGHGLGAIKRLSDTFQVYSLRNWGTVLLSRVYRDEIPHFKKTKAIEVRSVIVPKPGETACGDGMYSDYKGEYFRLFLGDGLGHGPEAQAAVERAAAAIAGSQEVGPVPLLRHMHTEVKKTRGLVGSIAVYSFAEKMWWLCGVGNIAARTHSATVPKNYMSYNGIIGLNMPNSLKEQEIPNERSTTIIMCSDGIKTRWELQKYPGIFKYDLSILAASIYKDHSRKTDDMSVVAVRMNTHL